MSNDSIIRLSSRCRAFCCANSASRALTPRCGTCHSTSAASSRNASRSAGANGSTTREPRALRFVLHVLEKAMVPRDDPAAAHAQHHPARLVAVAREADGVRVASAHHLHRLRLLDLIEPLQGVAQLGGALVVGA